MSKYLTLREAVSSAIKICNENTKISLTKEQGEAVFLIVMLNLANTVSWVDVISEVLDECGVAYKSTQLIQIAQEMKFRILKLPDSPI